MKFFISIFGPLLRPLNDSKAKYRKVLAIGFIIFLIPAEIYTISTALNRAAGWEKKEGVIAKKGTTAKGQEHSENTSSLVRFQFQGKQQIRSFSLLWELKEGEHVSVWARGTEATVHDPSRISKLDSLPIMGLISALIATLLLSGFLDWLRNAVRKHDEALELARKRAAERENQRRKEAAEHQEAKRVIELALSHGDTEVDISSNIWPLDYRHMDEVRRHFGERSTVQLGEVVGALTSQVERALYVSNFREILFAVLEKLELLDERPAIGSSKLIEAARAQLNPSVR